MIAVSSTGSKPLPLKQRTSSIDQRRDYSTQTWTSLLGMLKVREYVVTVDHFSIWRRHLAWAVPNGKELRDYMTQRYASSMVFMSLLLSTELSVLFNSAGVTTRMRHSLLTEDYLTVGFWAGFAIILSAILTLLGLISTFTAWTMVSAVSETNAHCVFRSSIGQYVAELPGRFIVGSIYSFLCWLVMFFFLLLPFGVWSVLLLVIVVCLFVHTITAFSAFGRVIMHTGAMGSQPIFNPSYERQLHPHGLHQHLATKARANLANNTSIMRQYRSEIDPIDRMWSQDELSTHLSDRSYENQVTVPRPPPSPSQTLPQPTRKRTASLVKFSDGFDTNGDRIRENGSSIPKKLSTIETNLLGTPVSTISNQSPSSGLPFKERPPRPGCLRDMEKSADIPNGTKIVPPSDDGTTDMLEKWLSSSHGSLNSSDQFSSASDTAEKHPLPPISHLSASRTNSVVSSLADLEIAEEDAQFEREYGGLFDPETATKYSFDYSSDGDRPNTTKDIEAMESGAATKDNYIIETKENPEEETKLLSADQLDSGNYASFRKPAAR